MPCSTFLGGGGWYIWFDIFCTVRFGGSSILWNFAGTPFCKFGGNLFFPQKGGLIHQKWGRSLPLREKRGSCQMYNTQTSGPSFPLVLVGKIPGKFPPIPNQNTESGYNSSFYLVWDVVWDRMSIRARFLQVSPVWASLTTFLQANNVGI